MNVEQRLRSALRDGAARLEVPEPGPGAARQRAARRGRRLHALTATAVVVAVAGGLLTVWAGVFDPDPTVLMDGGGGEGRDGTAVEAGDAEAAALDLRWQDAEGLLGPARDVFLGSDGAYYALSTAPGTRYEDFPQGDVPQAIYRSGDGLDWEVVPLGDDPWVADLGERDGLLYALSTAPGARGGSGQVALSDDGGETWQRADLPSTAAPPDAAVELGEAQVTGHLAVGEDLVVAAVRTRYPVDLTLLRAPGGQGDDRFWTQTPEGFALQEAPAGAGVPAEIDPTAPDDMVAPDGDGMTVPAPGWSVSPRDEGGERPVGPGTVPDQPQPQAPAHVVTWADMGLDGPDDLVVDEFFVSRDGAGWEPVPPPFRARDLRELTATPHGFVAVVHEPVTGGPGIVELLRSADGLAWEPVAGDGTLAAAGSLLAVGVVDRERLVAVPHSDGSALTVLTSDDGGRSWSETDLAPLVHDGDHEHVAVLDFDTGPLGTALAVVAAGPDPAASPDFFVLASPDAATWSATALVDVVDDGTAPRITWVAVGEDSVAVGTAWRPAGEGAPVVSRTLVGTPVR